MPKNNKHIKNFNTQKAVLIALPIMYFFALSVMILWQLLGRGYILTLDMIFTPEMHPSAGLGLATFDEYTLFILAKIIAPDILQKLILLTIFTLNGYLAYRLIYKVFNNHFIALTSGTLYSLNPFVYERFLAGQWLFLLGYSLAPLFVETVYNLFSHPEKEKNILYVLLAWLIIAFVSWHHFLLLGFIFLAFTLYFTGRELIKYRDLSKLSLVSVFAIFINLLWILLTIRFCVNLDFRSDQLIYFASSSYKDLGLLFNLLTFNGFWAEGILFNHIFSFYNHSAGLWFTILLITFSGVSIFTTVTVIKFSKRIYSQLKKINTKIQFKTNVKNSMFNDFTQYQIILIPLLIVGFTGLLLSLGSNGYIGKIYSFLIDDVPFLRGMREPQKFLSLYVLSFTVFFAFSLSLIKKVLDKVAEHYSADKVLNFIFKKTICLTFTLVIIFASFPIFFGAKHQLTLTDYPVIFSDFNELLKKEEGKERVLVLPWQNYMDFQWTQRRIADPSIRYFDAEIISRDKDSIFKDLKCDIEFKIDSGAENGTKYEGCFNYTDDPYVFSRTLKLLNIKYIIRHDVDIDTEVLNLLDKDYFEVVMSDGNMTVYRVNDQ